MLENDFDTFACGRPISAYLFFISFQVICSQIFLNLFVAIIVEAFLGQTDYFNSPIQHFHINDFVTTWYKYDKEATGFIKLRDLDKLIYDLSKTVDG